MFVMFLSGCANKDWYIHLIAHPKMDVDVSIGRGKADTVKKVIEEDHAQ
jgi:hypothetical protein